MALPRPAIRRPISVVTVFLATLLFTVTLPIVLLVLVLLDALRRQPLRRARFWCMATGVLVAESLGLLATGALTTFHAGRNQRPTAQRRFHRLERWWAGVHLRNLRRFVGLRWVMENPSALKDGNAIVLARHASHADALLPILLFGIEGGHRLRYTLKDELQWAPAMDIVGNRLPNVFLDRTPPADSPLWDQLRTLATDLDNDIAVIFPEGTFFTPERLDRAATRIGEHRPTLEATVRTLEHILPPRPAGTLALLEGAPEADLILVAHEGMESFGSLADIRRTLPLTSPVRVRAWRIARSEVPIDDDEFIEWLLDRWVDMDRWIEKRSLERRESGGVAPSLIGAKELL